MKAVKALTSTMPRCRATVATPETAAFDEATLMTAAGDATPYAAALDGPTEGTAGAMEVARGVAAMGPGKKGSLKFLHEARGDDIVRPAVLPGAALTSPLVVGAPALALSMLLTHSTERGPRGAELCDTTGEGNNHALKLKRGTREAADLVGADGKKVWKAYSSDMEM